MNCFFGAHIGRHSLHAQILQQDGRPLRERQLRFADGDGLTAALGHLIEEFADSEHWPRLGGAVVGLEKGHRRALPLEVLESRLPNGLPLLTLPAQFAILLGAVPSGPALLLSLGAELRLAAADSTHTYREFRLQEGGGLWWARELPKLAQHSAQLSQQLAPLRTEQQLLRNLPQLLQLADFPSPDPVLKVRLDGLCSTIASSCLGLTVRLPGLRRMSVSGFLHPSPMSRRILDGCAEYGPQVRQLAPRFPPEVGAALVGLAWHHENIERQHLNKPLEDGYSSSDRWELATSVIRKLYRLRLPFPTYPTQEAPR